MPWSRVWELFGGVLALGLVEGNQVRGLSFTQLPSAVGSRFREERTWVHSELEVDIRDFGMDPSQDLLVLISVALHGSVICHHPCVSLTSHIHRAIGHPEMEFRLHLRSLSTGKNHPYATDGVLSCRPEVYNMESGFVIQVMGDYVGVLFHPPLRPGFVFRDQLFIWNWKTGKLVSVCATVFESSS